MKIFIFASFLILFVNSSCSRRPIDKCLRDEQCQIIGTQCEKKPQSCKQIDITNPNNCSGFKCNYNKQLEICQSYKKLLIQQFHKSGKQKQGEQKLQENEQSENYSQQQNSLSENSKYLNQNIQASDNSMNDNSDEKDSNSVIMDKSLTTIYNSEVDYSKQDTIVFQIVDINFNQDELDNTEDFLKELVLVAINSSCINRTFDECLSLNVEYQENCQLSKGECVKRPQNCNEIDATYPLNCRTSECYFSKKFQKCLSQPFTRLLEDDVAYRGFGGHRDREQNRDEHRDSTQTQPQPMPPQPASPIPPPQEPQNPQQPPTLPPPQTNEDENNDNQDHQEEDVVDENQNDIGEENEDNNNQDSTDPEENVDESNGEQNNNENPNNNNEDSNNTNENINNNTEINNNKSVSTNNSSLEKLGFEGASQLEFLLQQEVKDQMQNSDVKQQIELSSWGIQLIVSLLIIWI